MKKHSIKLKIALWFCLTLALVAGLTFTAVRAASASVLRASTRDYLVSAVNENMDKIVWSEKGSEDPADITIPHAGGLLHIDSDFLQVINDVHTGLYTQDGVLLYGENPLSKVLDISFSASRIWRTSSGGEKYMIYDRQISAAIPGGEKLWIRGIVSESTSSGQLSKITKISLLLLPMVIIIVAAIGYLIVARLLSPLEKMEATADEISRGDDLHRRLAGSEKDDELGHLSIAFNRMLDRLEKTFEAEKQFTSDASHELRTPTAVILAQTEYTLEEDRCPEEYKEALGVIQRQGERMNSLIGDMLDYTRMEQDPGRYPMTEIDLSGLVLETAEQMRSMGRNMSSYTVEAEPGIHVAGNETLISRMLQNLISNAFRYGKDGGCVSVRLGVQDGKPMISVIDDGPGISKEEQEKIFDRFYRGDASRTVKGTGLGLSLVKKIAELHGADIELKSEPGKGADFRIIFQRL